MNKNNLKKLIKVMKAKKYGFLMAGSIVSSGNLDIYFQGKEITEDEFNICDTAACIAGHCMLISPMEEAVKFLDISSLEASKLFYPTNKYARYDVSIRSGKFITRDRAIKVLENLLDTGRVDWSVA